MRLEVREFRELTRWRWVLTDVSGAFVADHEVRLNPGDWQFEAFGDLPLYLRWHAAPDQRDADEARIVGEVGEWVGSQVLGAIGPALARKRPAIVRVVVPPEAASLGAGELLLRPLELAHVNGKPLSVQDVTLVLSSGAPGAGPAPVGERLRVLGLFSMPEGRRALNLRRERQELVRLIEGIAAAGKAADVRVLQYGVTREALRGVLEEAEGWDIVHLSGHGRPGSLLLETASGQLDLVEGPELADLLDLSRGRLKLVTVSACWSAAVAANEQRQMLGLPAAEDAADGTPRDDEAGTGMVPETLATGLTQQLGCAVLAMRYPVGDDFAIALAGKLYELLAAKGQVLPRAVGMTLRELASAPDSATFPALSMATPALFGEVAADLRLAAPDRLRPLDYGASRLKMAGFPPQASRFVGRTGVMARASSVLAAASGVPGVLLHGMPGGGKTACALELAYGHEHAFDRLVWYKAPDEGMAISGALTDFTLTLELALPGFQMAHVLVSAETLTGFLPRLTELMERRCVLIVIDNAESLLTESGEWRDDRWNSVTGALCGHSGLGRMVLTSRRVPVTGVTGLHVESVDALSAGETLLLIRELPNLQALGQGKVPGIDRLASRRLARRAIEAAQGHPKLLELADGQAANPERLAALVAAGDQAWREQGGLPEGFFSDGASSASGADYLQILAAWTKSVTETLTPGERDLFWFLCCLEEGDRELPVIEMMWPYLWDDLDRDGQPPDLDQAMAAITTCGLASIETLNGYAYHPVHPGVAEAGRDYAGQQFRDTVDTLAAEFWMAAHESASGQAGDETVDTELLVRAGLAAPLYLTRQQQWAAAGAFLEGAFLRDPSRSNAVAVLATMEQITRHEPRQIAMLARVLAVIDPAAADARLRSYLADAATRGDYRAATAAAGWLIELCREGGRLAEALELAGQMADYTRQADLGPWTQLNDEVQRLQVLNAMGHARQVLDEVTRLRASMVTLSVSGGNETVASWQVREMLLDTGRSAARILGQYADALALSAEVVASQRDRRAPATEIARVRYNDYFPLLRLGRTSEALDMLRDCHQVFLDARDVDMLGLTFAALADTEDARGNGDAALRQIRNGLRYLYLSGDINGIAACYHNLGNYLRDYTRQPAPAVASHLAAALIRGLTGIGGPLGAADSARQAIEDVRVFGIAAVLPTDVADLSRHVGDIPGTDLPGLLAALSPAPQVAEAKLRNLLDLAVAVSTPKRRWWPKRGTRRLGPHGPQAKG